VVHRATPCHRRPTRRRLPAADRRTRRPHSTHGRTGSTEQWRTSRRWPARYAARRSVLRFRITAAASSSSRPRSLDDPKAFPPSSNVWSRWSSHHSSRCSRVGTVFASKGPLPPLGCAERPPLGLCKKSCGHMNRGTREKRQPVQAPELPPSGENPPPGATPFCKWGINDESPAEARPSCVSEVWRRGRGAAFIN
jgi:hypothetical protein